MLSKLVFRPATAATLLIGSSLAVWSGSRPVYAQVVHGDLETSVSVETSKTNALQDAFAAPFMLQSVATSQPVKSIEQAKQDYLAKQKELAAFHVALADYYFPLVQNQIAELLSKGELYVGLDCKNLSSEGPGARSYNWKHFDPSLFCTLIQKRLKLESNVTVDLNVKEFWGEGWMSISVHAPLSTD